MRLQIFDSKGIELNPNDLVMIQEKRNSGITFFTKVQIINGQIYPFSHFCYDRIFKITSLPEGVSHSPAKIDMPEYWMDSNLELKMVEDGKLEAWRMESILFSNNSFYKVSVVEDKKRLQIF